MNALSFLTPKGQTVFLKADCTLRQAIEKLRYHKFKVIPLIDEEGKYVGTLSSSDLFGYFSTCEVTDISQTENISIKQLINCKHYKSCNLGDNSNKIINLLFSQVFVPIVDDRGIFCGIIERKKVSDYYSCNHGFGLSKDKNGRLT